MDRFILIVDPAILVGQEPEKREARRSCSADCGDPNRMAIVLTAPSGL